MTTENFNTAKDRLERAKKEMLRVVDVLNDPTTHNLTQDEQKELFLESQRKLAEIREALSDIPPWEDKDSSISEKPKDRRTSEKPMGGESDLNR